jgi:transposase
MSHPFSLDVKLQKACGIDLHKDQIKACYMSIDKSPQHKDFGTTTLELKKLCQDLISQGISDVVIESTGIYWIPLYDLLTGQGMKVVIANPLRVKQIPGKKTDTSDSEWLCKLLLNGLVHRSFIPDTTLRQLRQLNRQRYFYTGHLSQVKNRILKVLETANLKLRSVLSNINTKSARKIVQALADGETDIKVLQSYCLRKAAKKAALLPEALDGTLTGNDRALLQLHLADWQYYDQQILHLDKAMQDIIQQHYADTISRLILVPGIGLQSACTIVAEVGHTLESFPTADQFTSWAGLAPGNRQSANTWYAQHITKGNKYFRSTLLQVAWAAARTKNGYWQAHFQYLRKRLPAKKAIVAIARKMAKLIYRVIKDHYQYEEKGAEYFTERRHKYPSDNRSTSVAG